MEPIQTKALTIIVSFMVNLCMLCLCVPHVLLEIPWGAGAQEPSFWAILTMSLQGCTGMVVCHCRNYKGGWGNSGTNVAMRCALRFILSIIQALFASLVDSFSNSCTCKVWQVVTARQ